ncbi:MAG TPA: zinc ribbon domain-containing protein [Caproiciproducens sp.]|nr:zinc ribbon domain-containing protein [Caproiciproducens sp.]
MFLIFGFTNGQSSIGTRRCRFFTCCSTGDTMAYVTCTYQQFTLFFLPLFRFNKRYLVTCPGCGTVYEIPKEEGQRLERNYAAEINPNLMYAVHRSNKKICPNCKCAVDQNSRYCPNCGTSLL